MYSVHTDNHLKKEWRTLNFIWFMCMTRDINILSIKKFTSNSLCACNQLLWTRTKKVQNIILFPRDGHAYNGSDMAKQVVRLQVLCVINNNSWRRFGQGTGLKLIQQVFFISILKIKFETPHSNTTPESKPLVSKSCLIV